MEMSPPLHPQDKQETRGGAATPADASATEAAKGKPPRTRGLWLLDTFLYGFINNTSVFLLSVAATYLTNKGGAVNPEGKLVYGKLGEFFNKRGNWLVKKFEAAGMPTKAAEMSKMVFFSWADGTLLAPVVKLVEDRRESLGRWLDKKMGTQPADDSVYSAEPKQSWGSVLGGRMATCAIVVPTAVALQKSGLNDTLFYGPGKKIGEKIARTPKLSQWFGKLDVAELGKVSLFEAFYTTVCTIGLYFSSRLLAGKFSAKHSKKDAVSPLPAQRPIVDHVLASPAPPSLPSPANDSLQTAPTDACLPSERIQLPPEGLESERIENPRKLGL